GAWEATVEPIGSLAEVTPGSITIEASAAGGTKTAMLYITVDLEGGGCGGGDCNPPNPVVPGRYTGAFQIPSVAPFPSQASHFFFGLFGTTFSANHSVSSRFQMGRSAFGKFAGNLSLHHAYPTNKLSKPDLLRWSYGTNTACEVLINSNFIRQIKSCQ